MQRTILVLLAAALAAGAAHAAEEKYQRKSGLWELRRAEPQSPDQVAIYRMCVDHTADNALLKLGTAMRAERCQPSKVARNGDKLTLDAVCEMDHGRIKAATHTVITGKLDSAYTVESNWTFSPPRHKETGGSAVINAKWTGECQPDQHPGDLILPSGLKINVYEEKAGNKKAAEKAAKEPGGAMPHWKAMPPSQRTQRAPAPSPAPASPPATN
jgi:hypothetical protein